MSLGKIPAALLAGAAGVGLGCAERGRWYMETGG